MTADERRIEMLKLITAAEQHFNNLCFNIRALASTWLLATLAGVGWILKDLPAKSSATDFAIDKVDLLILLCVASSIGIFVLWIMDIMVYQRFTNVWFDSRKKYEVDDSLPSIRADMKNLFVTGRATELIMIFYMALTAAPLALAIFIAHSAGARMEFWLLLLFLVLIIGALIKFSPIDKKWMIGADEKQTVENENFFNLDAMGQGIQRQLADGMTTRVFAGEEAMISVVRIDADKFGSRHSHPQEQWGLCVRGSGMRWQNGEEIEVSAGDFWRTPGGIEHGFTAGPNGAIVFDVFAPPREEYIKSGSGFGESPESGG